MRFARVFAVTVCALLTTACAALGGDDGDGEIDPRSGAWNYTGSTPVDDTCMIEALYVDDPGTFGLTNNGDETITIDDGTNVFDCELDGADFSCPSRLSGENDVGATYNLDAVVVYNVVAYGSFSTNNKMSGRQEITLDCVGADCPTLAAVAGVTIPCGWAQDFVATHN